MITLILSQTLDITLNNLIESKYTSFLFIIAVICIFVYLFNTSSRK